MPYKNANDQLKRNKRYYEGNSEKIKERATNWNRMNKEKRKIITMNSNWKVSGIMMNGSFFTYEDYNKMFNEQSGCCKICNKHQADLSKTLSVDHNHETGEARGLLCQRCNTILGMSLDSIEILNSAINYLRENT